MKRLTIIIIILPIIIYSQNKQSNHIDSNKLPKEIIYVSKPNPTDSLCISEIKKAKRDIAKGKIAFTHKVGFCFGDIRYEKELRELCKLNGLEFGLDVTSDVIIQGQTQGCYGNYMDKIIIEKYGVGFKEKLHKKADSIFLVRTNLSNQLVRYYRCDERPRLPNETKRTEDALPNIVVNNLEIIGNQFDNDSWPFMDIGFIVEKDSTISNIYLGYFYEKVEENKKFKENLFTIAVDNLKNKFPIWVPGKIKGTPVRTDNNVRFYFVTTKK